MAKSPIKLSVVHPGGVATNIARNSRTGVGMTDNARRAQSIERFDAVAKTTPAAAALRIIEGIEKNQPRILIGNDARFMDLLQRFRPGTLLVGAAAADREGDAGGEVAEADSLLRSNGTLSRRPGERRDDGGNFQHGMPIRRQCRCPPPAKRRGGVGGGGCLGKLAAGRASR